MVENNDPTPKPGEDGFVDPTPSIVESFNEESKTYLNDKGIKDEASIINALKAAEQFEGIDLKAMVKIPGAESTPEEALAAFTALGRPEKAEDYGIKAPEGDDTSFMEAMLPILHKANLTKTQATEVAEGWNALLAANKKTIADKHEADLAALKTEWAGDTFTKNETLAKRAAAELGLDETSYEGLKKTLGTAGTYKMFHKIGVRAADHTIHDAGGKSTPANYKDPMQAKAKIAELMKDRDFAQRIVNNDAEAIKLWNNLHQAAGPLGRQSS